MSWIGVDLDGTLAYYDGWKGVDNIGAPIPLMVGRVKRWLREGKTIKVFTARMHNQGMIDPQTKRPIDALTPIETWCKKHIGVVLEVTNVKDFDMIELYDDRCIQVRTNTGRLVE